MMRCYFHLINGSEVIRDIEGVNLIDHRSARGAALQAVEEMRRAASDTDDWDGWELVVTNASHAILFTIQLSSCEWCCSSGDGSDRGPWN